MERSTPITDQSSCDILMGIIGRLPRYVRLVRRLITDGRIPTIQKAPLVGSLGYSALPIDFVPGLIPVLGQLDDAIVLLGALRLTLSRVAPEIADEHLDAAGLTRFQIDTDYRDAWQVAERIGVAGARAGGYLAGRTAHAVGRLADRGRRTLRAW